MAQLDTLEGLIDRCLLVQEAKRNISDKKMLDSVNKAADEMWHDNDVLPLERKFNVETELQLKEKLAGQGRSLDTMRQSFRQSFLAETYIRQKLRDRVNVELPDLLKYYNEHLNTREFDRPAQIKWRELVVEVAKYESLAAARRKADGLLEAIKKGEDLAKLARASSDGPTGSRNQGGLMETSPGGYAVAAVNSALLSLPIGQVSSGDRGGAAELPHHQGREPPPRRAGVLRGSAGQDQAHRPEPENPGREDRVYSQTSSENAHHCLQREKGDRPSQLIAERSSAPPFS